MMSKNNDNYPVKEKSYYMYMKVCLKADNYDEALEIQDSYFNKLNNERNHYYANSEIKEVEYE